jgi:4-diphosphocytidyl-2-C-methyl-D-erythritol kinase
VTRILAAPAKVNLTLDVLGRRDDGYHEIATVLLALTLADRVSVERTGGGIEVTCEGFDVPEGDSNIAHRAAVLCLQEFGLEGGCRIHIEKNIPVGAGLGGGSSDAGAIINRLADEAQVADREARRRVAARVGSDVAFFIDGGCALATGRGEIIEPLTIPEPVSVVVVFPGGPVSTSDAYARIELGDPALGECSSFRMADLVRGRASWRDITAAFSNDFENVVAAERPDIVEAERFLIENGALGAMLAGSGGAVFGVFDDPDQARTAADLARLNFGWAAATETVRG